MSKFVKDLVETIEQELNSVSPYGSLDNVEDEVKELIDAIKHQNCNHCNMNIEDNLCSRCCCNPCKCCSDYYKG